MTSDRDILSLDDAAHDPDPARLGEKGASLAEMRARGLPVPDGFVLSADVSLRHREHGWSSELDAPLRAAVEALEERTARRFGDPDRPLLVSVRAAAPTSMPGMLETVLNVGMRADVARAIGDARGAPRLGLDLHRRFLESYAEAVLGVPHDAFDALLMGRELDTLDHEALRALIEEYGRSLAREAGEPLPDDPHVQLRRAIEGVFASWELPRAQKYREAHDIPDELGVAVVVQAMVLGNHGPRSGAAVAFSRHPSTGAPELFGEWIASGQGDELMGGRRTPWPLGRDQVRRGTEDRSLETAMPELVATLRDHVRTLEAWRNDMVEVELTIEDGVLHLLQCRTAKRSAQAAARVAVDLVNEGKLDQRAALRRIEPASLRQLLTPRLPDPQALSELGIEPVARGLAASPGAATGRLVLSPEAVAEHAGEDTILARAETSADDVDAMRQASGVLTAVGGLTCHAAVVARAMGKPCVVGASSIDVDTVARQVRVPGTRTELDEGDVVTLDGTRGLIYACEVPVEPAPASPHVETLLGWADAIRTIEVWAEVSSPRLAQVAARYGADRLLLGAELGVAEARSVAGGLPLAVRADRASEVGEADRVLESAEASIESGDAVTVHVGPGVSAVIVAPLDIPIARLRAACVEGS